MWKYCPVLPKLKNHTTPAASTLVASSFSPVFFCGLSLPNFQPLSKVWFLTWGFLLFQRRWPRSQTTSRQTWGFVLWTRVSWTCSQKPWVVILLCMFDSNLNKRKLIGSGKAWLEPDWLLRCGCSVTHPASSQRRFVFEQVSSFWQLGFDYPWCFSATNHRVHFLKAHCIEFIDIPQEDELSINPRRTRHSASGWPAPSASSALLALLLHPWILLDHISLIHAARPMPSDSRDVPKFPLNKHQVKATSRDQFRLGANRNHRVKAQRAKTGSLQMWLEISCIVWQSAACRESKALFWY